MHRDRLPGGKADRLFPSNFDPWELREGTRVEFEHTNDPFVAREIAMDHLQEDPLYYRKLKTIHVDGLGQLDEQTVIWSLVGLGGAAILLYMLLEY
jgi:hypothetical protein